MMQQLNLTKAIEAGYPDSSYDFLLVVLRHYNEDLSGLGFSESTIKDVAEFELRNVWRKLDLIISKFNRFESSSKSQHLSITESLGELFGHIKKIKLEERASKHGEEIQLLKQEIQSLKKLRPESRASSNSTNRNTGGVMPRSSLRKSFVIKGKQDKVPDVNSRVQFIEVQFENLQNELELMKNDSREKTRILKESISAELEELRIYREKIQLEVETIKVLNEQTRIELIKRQSIPQVKTDSPIRRLSKIVGDGAGQPRIADGAMTNDIRFLMIEFEKLKNEIEEMTQTMEKIKFSNAEKMERMTRDIDDVRLGMGNTMNTILPSIEYNKRSDLDKKTGVEALERLMKKHSNLTSELKYEIMDHFETLEAKINRMSKERNPLKDTQIITSMSLRLKKLEQKIVKNKDEIRFLSEQVKFSTLQMETLKSDQNAQGKKNQIDTNRESNTIEINEIKSDFRKEIMRVKMDTEGVEDRVLVNEEKMYDIENNLNILKTVVEKSKNVVLMNGFKNRLDKVEDELDGFRQIVSTITAEGSVADVLTRLNNDEKAIETLKTNIESITSEFSVVKKISKEAEDNIKRKLDLMVEQLDQSMIDAESGVLEVKKVLQQLEEEKFAQIGTIERLQKHLANEIERLSEFVQMEQVDLRDWAKDENKKIFDFIQEYINEVSMYQLTTLKSEERSPTHKMDAIDWFARNIEFVPARLFEKMFDLCYEQYSKPAEKSFFNAPHTSDLISSLKRLLHQAIKDGNESMWMKLLPSHLAITELSLLSKSNRRKGVDKALHETLITLALENRFPKDINELALSCLALLLQEENIIIQAIQNRRFIEFMANSLDQEIPNGRLKGSILSILKMCFLTKDVVEPLIALNHNLINQIIQSFTRDLNDKELIRHHLDVIIILIRRLRHLVIITFFCDM